MKKMTDGILAGLAADESLMRWARIFRVWRQKVSFACVHCFLEGEAAFFGVGGHEYPLDGY